MNPSFEDLFADLEIDETRFKEILKIRYESFEEYTKIIKEEPNLLVLTEMLHWSGVTDNEAEANTRRYKAWRNFIKLFITEFMNDPYWNSRFGWFIWFLVCYARYDSYYPLGWCFHYDPANFYRTGEPHRPKELESPPPDDPFNVKGECFVHPEWYKDPKYQKKLEEPNDPV